MIESVSHRSAGGIRRIGREACLAVVVEDGEVR